MAKNALEGGWIKGAERMTEKLETEEAVGKDKRCSQETLRVFMSRKGNDFIFPKS